MPALVNAGWSKERRRGMRAKDTLPENLLWHYLRNRDCGGIKFRRQVGIGPYIVDFYAYDKKLVIEVDGSVHASVQAQEYDRERDHFLREQGLEVLRFTNKEIFDKLPSVLDSIKRAAHVPTAKSGDGQGKTRVPSPRSGEG